LGSFEDEQEAHARVVLLGRVAGEILGRGRRLGHDVLLDVARGVDLDERPGKRRGRSISSERSNGRSKLRAQRRTHCRAVSIHLTIR